MSDLQRRELFYEAKLTQEQLEDLEKSGSHSQVENLLWESLKTSRKREKQALEDKEKELQAEKKKLDVENTYSRFQVNEVRASGHGSASAPTINDIICTSPNSNLLYFCCLSDNAIASTQIAIRSSLTTIRSSLIAIRSSLTTIRSSLIAIRSSLTTIRSSLIAIRSSLIAIASGEKAQTVAIFSLS